MFLGDVDVQCSCSTHEQAGQDHTDHGLEVSHCAASYSGGRLHND